MREVFADTSHYIALANPRDAHHSRAVLFSREYTGRIVTTEFVLAELGAWLSRGADRDLFVEIWRSIRSDPATNLIPSSTELFRRGVDLFSRRRDKDWTLIDCISFETMREYGILEALTADHYFEQAGFNPLLK